MAVNNKLTFPSKVKVGCLGTPICVRNHILLPSSYRVTGTFSLQDFQDAFILKIKRAFDGSARPPAKYKTAGLFLCNAFALTQATGYGRLVYAGITREC